MRIGIVEIWFGIVHWQMSLSAPDMIMAGSYHFTVLFISDDVSKEPLRPFGLQKSHKLTDHEKYLYRNHAEELQNATEFILVWVWFTVVSIREDRRKIHFLLCTCMASQTEFGSVKYFLGTKNISAPIKQRLWVLVRTTSLIGSKVHPWSIFCAEIWKCIPR